MCLTISPVLSQNQSKHGVKRDRAILGKKNVSLVLSAANAKNSVLVGFIDELMPDYYIFVGKQLGVNHRHVFCCPVESVDAIYPKVPF